MIKTVCVKKCFDNKMYFAGETRIFESVEEAKKQVHFKITENPKKKRVKKTEGLENG